MTTERMNSLTNVMYLPDMIGLLAGENIALVEAKPELDSLTFLRTVLDGTVTVVSLDHPETGETLDIWLNDEGMINGMPPNVLVARLIAWYAEETGQTLAQEMFFGAALLCGVDKGDTVSIPDAWIPLVEQVLRLEDAEEE